MSGSTRKRKSLWDSKEETRLPAQISSKNAWHGKESNNNLHASHDRKWSGMEDNSAFKSKDCSGWLSSEPPRGNSVPKYDRRNLHDIAESRKAWDGNKGYHGSPGFDEWGEQNHSRSQENSWSQSHRHRRSRSQSRSRSRGRERGRSRSRSRGRERSRSRSRDRDREWGRSRSRSRSRSPLGDYRRESYGGSDRRGGLGVSSQPCRDFTAGNRRRGSQSRFVHEDDLDQRDGAPRLEKHRAERWNRQDHGVICYNGEQDEPLKNRSKLTMRCNDFLKGTCHRGSSCRYLHDDASGDRSERSYRNSSSDQSYKQQPHNNFTVPCKFFMMGKCQRDNCRFSHDGAVHGNLGGKSQEGKLVHDFEDVNQSWNGPKWGETNDSSDVAQSTGWGNVGRGTFTDPTTAEKENGECHSLDDKTKKWNGPTWDDATGVSDIPKSTGWGNSIVETVKLTGTLNAEDYADDGWDHRLEWKHKDAERDQNASTHCESGSFVVNMDITGSNDVAKSFKKEEPSLSSHVLQSQVLYEIPENVPEGNIMQEASGQKLDTTVMHLVFPENSQVLQHHTSAGDSSAKTDFCNSVNRVDIYGKALVPGQNSHQKSESFGCQPLSSAGINQSLHVVPVNPSNGHNIDLNDPLQQNLAPDLQNQTPVQHGEYVETTANFVMLQNVVNSERVAQMTDFPASVTQIFGNGELPQLFVSLNPSNPIELVPRTLDSASLPPPITSVDAQPDPVTMSPKQYDPTGHSVEPKKPGNQNQPLAFLSSSIEQNSQMLLERLSPSRADGPDCGDLHKNGIPVDNNLRIPELRQQKPVANSLLQEDSISMAEKCKQEPENIPAGNVDAGAKIVDGPNGKDEKAMRMFKNALVEFVKDILKPKWKEGQMSREVHKSIVKKVVEKVSCTIQGVNVPKTQEKIEQYLSFSKPKLAKLVEAYTERFLKAT